MGRKKTVGCGYDKSQKKSPWYIRVNGVKSYFPTQKERDDAHTAKEAELQAFGFGAAGDLTAADRLAITEMRRAAQRCGLEPMEIFRRGLASVTENPGLPLQGAIDRYLAYCEKRVNQGTMRRLTWKDLGRINNHFSKFCGPIAVADVTKQKVDDFSVAVKGTANSHANRVARVSMMFGWLVKEGIVSKNPCKKPAVPKVTPVTYPLEKVRGIMRAAERICPRIVPMLALQWFAGMRPHATQNIHWEHIDFTRKRIVIPPEFSKSGEPELVERLPAAVWAWLRAYRQKAGRISFPKHDRAYREVKRACGIQDWPADVGRHTFASNLYGLTGSIEEVARALLHHTTKITLKHYVAKGLTKAQGTAYFALRPARRRV